MSQFAWLFTVDPTSGGVVPGRSATFIPLKCYRLNHRFQENSCEVHSLGGSAILRHQFFVDNFAKHVLVGAADGCSSWAFCLAPCRFRRNRWGQDICSAINSPATARWRGHPGELTQRLPLAV